MTRTDSIILFGKKQAVLLRANSIYPTKKQENLIVMSAEPQLTKCQKKNTTTSINFVMKDGHENLIRKTNLIRMTKKQNKSQNNFITVEKPSNHFSNKFSDSKTVNEFIRLADVTVSKKYEKLCDSSVNNPRLTVSVQSVVKYIKQLNTYCSPGIDGISSEHLIYALDSTVILYISKLLSLCVTFGIVPDSFSKGLMIPVLKKNNIDPSTPKNYRPITISTTFSKLLELYILEMSSGHSFDPMQFGFVEGRGTAMAISLATDVSQLCQLAYFYVQLGC